MGWIASTAAHVHRCLWTSSGAVCVTPVDVSAGACQAGDSLFGFCTDLVRAFKALPRCPPFKTQGFLDRVERRFLVRAIISDAVRSVCGFPEGDPLSTVAMATANLLFHLYQCPQPVLRCNLAGMTGNAGSLASGWAAVTAFVRFCTTGDRCQQDVCLGHASI